LRRLLARACFALGLRLEFSDRLFGAFHRLSSDKPANLPLKQSDAARATS
jgi:hypothetical protein